MNRYTVKPDLRTLGEMAIVMVLGKVPRKLRRAAGRRYANTTYRRMNGLASIHTDYKVNQTVTDWIAKRV